MANKIAINDEDFTSLEENLIAKHKSIIELVGNVVKQLQDLSRRDGEFYTDSISPKVQLLCDELNDAKSSMEEIYSAHTDIISVLNPRLQIWIHVVRRENNDKQHSCEFG